MKLRNLLKGSNTHQTLTEWHPLEELDDEPEPSQRREPPTWNLPAGEFVEVGPPEPPLPTGWRQDGPGTFHAHQEPCPVCEASPDPTAGSAASTATGRDVTSPDAAATEPAQCTATTRSGGQCKFPARPGTDRCALPSHQRM